MGDPLYAAQEDTGWADEVGVTTSSFSHQVSPNPGKGQFTVFDLPKVVHDELGMRVIDLNTTTLGSLEPAHVERFGKEVERAGCVVTNLKTGPFPLRPPAISRRGTWEPMAHTSSTTCSAALPSAGKPGLPVPGAWNTPTRIRRPSCASWACCGT